MQRIITRYNNGKLGATVEHGDAVKISRDADTSNRHGVLRADILDANIQQLKLSYKEKLELHLVAAKRKPAAMFMVDNTLEASCKIRDSLLEFGFDVMLQNSIDIRFADIFVALDRRTCELAAFYSNKRDILNLGLSLGYPINAIKSYIDRVNLGVGPYIYTIHSYLDGMASGAKLHDAIAYSSHIPETVSVSNGIVTIDTESMELAKCNRAYAKNVSKEILLQLQEIFRTELDKYAEMYHENVRVDLKDEHYIMKPLH